MSLIIGGVTVPYRAGHSMRQAFSRLPGGTSTLRMADGSGVKQQAWRKQKTQINGMGWVPNALQSLDYSQPLQLHCIAPLTVSGPAPVIELPASRRSDAGYEPKALAWVGGEAVEVELEISGNTATATTVAEAEFYQVSYWPVMMVFAEFEENTDTATGVISWQLACEEV